MSEVRIDSVEERISFLAEKVEREGMRVPYEVIEYIAERCYTAQSLKSSLLTIATVARRNNGEVDLRTARTVVEGFDPEDPEAVAAAEAAAAVAPVQTGYRSPLTGPSQGAGHAAAAGPAVGDVEPAPGFASAPVRAPQPAPVATQPELAPEPEPEPEPHAVEPEPEDEFSEFVAEAEAVVVVPEPVTGTLFAEEAAPAQPASGGQPKAVVWFAPMRTTKKESLVKRAGKLLQRAGLAEAIDEGDLVAIKLHFGEEGNTGFVSPVFLREVVARVRDAGGKPFLTDSNTLYRGKRFNAVDHLACAIHNGFSYATVDAPVIIADGLDGREAVDVPIEGFMHFDSVRIGAAAVHADAMVVVTHVKGHEATGFGGALKNVGMGLGCRSAKQRMHSDFEPHPSAEKCTACGRCVKWCPVDAMTIGPDRVAAVDYDVCYGCGECVAACPYGAIAINWKTTPEAIQEKIVEHVAGVVKDKAGKVVYLSFVKDVSPDCDCWHFSDASVVPDIGVLASTDPIAIDQAAYDLVVKAEGQAGSLGEGMASGTDKFKEITGIDGTVAMVYGEMTGLGTRDYELRTLE